MNQDDVGAFEASINQLNDLEAELARIDTLAKNVGETITSAFTDALVNGKSLKGLLADIARSFAQIALKAALKPIGGLITDMIGGLFQSTNPALPAVQPFAKGGVLNTPKYFPMNGGVGLAGEVGAEAIMPLKRNSRGQLGVAAESNAAPILISMTVNATDARSFVQAEAEISAGLLGALKRGQRAS